MFSEKLEAGVTHPDMQGIYSCRTFDLMISPSVTRPDMQGIYIAKIDGAIQKWEEFPNLQQNCYVFGHIIPEIINTKYKHSHNK